MLVDASEKGGVLTTDQDSRIARVGRILRKSKIDELLQSGTLPHILRGEAINSC
jgi:lipopolysaccharide/colanic/teichoic acid biosynthesis glycosyltransferase